MCGLSASVGCQHIRLEQSGKADASYDAPGESFLHTWSAQTWNEGPAEQRPSQQKLDLVLRCYGETVLRCYHLSRCAAQHR